MVLGRETLLGNSPPPAPADLVDPDFAADGTARAADGTARVADGTRPAARDPTDDDTALLESILAYARERDYVGWDYGDGLSSAPARWLPAESRWAEIAIQEAIKRAPVNVRPFLGVERKRNHKGAGLFVLANLRARDLTSRAWYGFEARRLANWLVETGVDGYAGFCVGHNHPVRGLTKRTPPGVPGVVGTTYAVLGLLAADAALDEPLAPGGARYADVARTAADFVLSDLAAESTTDQLRIRYKPNEPDAHYTINANALGARLLVELYDRFGGERLRDGARRILNYVVSRQTDAGGWHYRDPPDASHLSMDNHHNGFVVEALQRWAAVVGDARFADATHRALSFYREVLFEENGAPNFDESSAYPRDVHAATQGVLVFVRAGDAAFARRVLDWTVEHLHAGGGRFYVRAHRRYVQRHVLMRWCQAWMAHAVGELLAAERGG